MLEYIRKGRRTYRPLAIRLKILKEDSTLYIVIFCPENKCDRVRQYFFKKKCIKALWKPDNKSLPLFEVAVFGRPPETKVAECNINVSILVVDDKLGFSTDTFYGSPILITYPSGRTRCATLGGIIKLTNSDGKTALYSITAGYVIDNLKDKLSDKGESYLETEPEYLGEFLDLDLSDDKGVFAVVKRVELLLSPTFRRIDHNGDSVQL